MNDAPAPARPGPAAHDRAGGIRRRHERRPRRSRPDGRRDGPRTPDQGSAPRDAGPPPSIGIGKLGGRAAFYLDGKPEPPLFVCGSEKTYSLAGVQGQHIHYPFASMDWEAPYDNSNTCVQLKWLVQNHDPKGRFILRVGIDTPASWRSAHPDQLILYSDGAKGEPSPASTLWRNDAATVVRSFVKQVEAGCGDLVVGYNIGAFAEGCWWAYERLWESDKVLPSFETPARDAFREFARKRYSNDVAALRKAWAMPSIAFDTIEVPTYQERQAPAARGEFRDPRTEQRLIDWAEFQNVVMAEVLELMGGIIKTETARKKIVFFYYGYTLELVIQHPMYSGHYATERILRSPDIDFLGMSPTGGVTAHALSYVRSEFNRSGVPYGAYFLSDVLDGRVTWPKVYFIMNAYLLTDAQKTALAGALRKDKKVAVWVYAPGFLGGAAPDPARVANLVELPLTESAGGGDITWESGSHALLQGLAGTYTLPYYSPYLSPRFAIPAGSTPAGATTIAHFDDGAAAIIVRPGTNYTTIYVGTPGFPAGFIRNVARLAGAQVYTETNEVVAANDRFVVVSSTSAGTKTIKLPKPKNVTDAIDGATVGSGVTQFQVPFQLGETRVFELK